MSGKKIYLKLITDKDLGGFHVTYLFFGTNPWDQGEILKALGEMGRFTLRFKGEALFGPNSDMLVGEYECQDQGPHEARKRALEACSPEIQGVNRELWKPHITGLTKEMVGEKGWEEILVTGVQTNDGKMVKMF